MRQTKQNSPQQTISPRKVKRLYNKDATNKLDSATLNAAWIQSTDIRAKASSQKASPKLLSPSMSLNFIFKVVGLGRLGEVERDVLYFERSEC